MNFKKKLIKVLVFGIIWGVVFGGTTGSFFSDLEGSDGNVFAAGSLDFSLSSPADFTPEVKPDQSSSREIGLQNNGSLGFQYSLQAANFVGDLCDYLNLIAKLDGIDQYSGLLTGFNQPVGVFTAPEDWQFTVDLTSSDPGLQAQTCNFDFIFSATQIGGSGFTDEEIIGNQVQGGDWEGPESSATDNQPDYRNTSNFDVDYTASDNLSGVKEVKLYYRYNYGSWQFFGTDSVIDNKFEFNSPAGDGFYEFKTAAWDNTGNEEDEDDNGTGDSSDLVTLPVLLLPDASTTVDTAAPVTMLSVPDPMAVANELIYNGGFESGDLSGWAIDSNGSDHQATIEDKKTGNYSALIGFKNAAPSAEPAYDLIKQSLTLPSWITSTLSFWYHLLTDSNASGGFFDAIVKHGLDEIKVAHDGWDDPTISDTDLNWKNVTYQLNGLEGENIEVQFKVTQPDSSYQTWSYLDEVKVCAATNSATTATEFSLFSHDGSGADNSTINYSIDGVPQGTYSVPFILSEGVHNISYSSTDEAGNSETLKQATISATAAAVDFGVVLNEFLPNPAGNDDALKPGGEWVKLYNNSGVTIDVNSWVLYDADDTHELVISSSNSDNDGDWTTGETVVPAGGILTAYRDGDSDFVLNNSGGDTVRLYNGPISSGGMLVDSFTYTIDVPDGKSFKRDPDGTGGWKDPQAEPAVDFYFQNNKTSVGFKVSGIKEYQQFTYEISYQAGEQNEGIMGNIVLNGEEEITRKGLILGTCSSGGTCVHHLGIKTIYLKIILKSPGQEKVLEEDIDY